MLNIAIIGIGRIGQKHAKCINKYARLTAICDINEEKAKTYGKIYNSKIFYDIDDLLTSNCNIDIVSICTPNGLHAEHAIKSLRADYHVLCEKPMALNVNDCKLMIAESYKSGKSLSVVKQNRFNPPVVKVKQMINEGSLGKLYSFQLNCFWNRNEEYYTTSDWKGTRDLDGGTLYTQFSHFIDLLYWILGDVGEVYCILDNFHHKKIVDFEDTGVVVMRFQNGVIGSINFTVNAYSKNMEGSLTFFGEKGTVKIGGQYLNELEYQDIKGIEIKNLSHGNPPNNYGKYVGSMSNHNLVYKELVNMLTNNGFYSVNIFDCMKTVEIINKIYLSAIKKQVCRSEELILELSM